MSFWQIDPKALIIRADELTTEYLGQEIVLPFDNMTVIGQIEALSFKRGLPESGVRRVSVEVTAGSVEKHFDGKDLVQITSLVSKLPY